MFTCFDVVETGSLPDQDVNVFQWSVNRLMNGLRNGCSHRSLLFLGSTFANIALNDRHHFILAIATSSGNAGWVRQTARRIQTKLRYDPTAPESGRKHQGREDSFPLKSLVIPGLSLAERWTDKLFPHSANRRDRAFAQVLAGCAESPGA